MSNAKTKKAATYSDAGVNIDNATKAVSKIKGYAKSTKTKHVLSDVGSFGGMMAVPKNYKEPVLVGSADGVGTKIKLAFKTKIHTTVGQDLVNHCVNDILVQGAKPLFFLDYVGTGKLDPNAVADVVKGIAKACKENGCALVGGEIAEMPGIYNGHDYDLASTIVGIVEKKDIVTGKEIKDGDVIIALPSTGLHTNGYSLAIKLLVKGLGGKYSLKAKPKGLQTELGKALMAIHKSYLKPVMALMKKVKIHGMVHITGGGIWDNIPRVLPKDCDVVIDPRSWKVPAIFKLIQKEGNVTEKEMFRTFNMGLGMLVIVDKKDAETALKTMSKHEKAWIAGAIQKGKGSVKLLKI